MAPALMASSKGNSLRPDRGLFTRDRDRLDLLASNSGAIPAEEHIVKPIALFAPSIRADDDTVAISLPVRVSAVEFESGFAILSPKENSFTGRKAVFARPRPCHG